MFIVILRYKAQLTAIDAALEKHRAWLEQGYRDGIFLLSGPQVPRAGGAILAHGLSRAELDRRLAQDPFAASDLAEYEVITVAMQSADPRLAFLLQEQKRAS